MMLKDYPEYFASYKIYEIVRDTMKNYARESDIDKMFIELISKEATPADFLRHLSVICKRHINVSKASKMMLAIKENLAKLIEFEVEPKDLTITKEGKGIMKVLVHNKTDGTFKFKVGLQQMNRAYTAILFSPVKNFSLTKLIKGAIIEPGKTHTFKFMLKPDVFGIDDLYELKKDNEIKFNIGMQIAIDGVDGMKTNIKKMLVTVIKHRL